MVFLVIVTLFIVMVFVAAGLGFISMVPVISIVVVIITLLASSLFRGLFFTKKYPAEKIKNILANLICQPH